MTMQLPPTVAAYIRAINNFDRTGLPDPVIINHHITIEGGKIVGLICRLASEQPGS